jgi:gliding motility-associated-like protein
MIYFVIEMETKRLLNRAFQHLTILLLLLWVGIATAQDVTLAGPGACNGAAVTGNWTVPCGVTSITVEAYGGGGGAGGGGGGSNGGLFNTRGGGGGGGGGFTTITINVIPGSTFAYSIGAGGCGGGNGGDGSSGGNGTAGGNTTFTGTDAGGTAVTLAANGGARGTGGSGTNGSTGNGGAGGTASGGTTNTNGTAGLNGSGGTGGNGGAASGSGGGAGGTGSGAAGVALGGGGAGGGNSPGGRGAAGGILITYSGAPTLLPAATVTSTPPSCSTDGSSTIDNYNPAATVTFTPAGPTVGAGGLINGMVTGTSYTLVYEVAGCSSEPSASFSNAASTGIAPTPMISVTPPSCTAPGSSTISNYNAAMSYTFNPAGPTVGAGGAISGMTVGTSYTVIANEGPCISAASAAFSNAAQLAGPNITITGTLTHCNGGTTTITGNGGVSYVWDDPAISTTASINVTQGTYTVSGTDANGCTGTATAVVTESAPFAITFTGPLSHCPGGTTTVTASGGATYVWSTGATTASATLTQGTHTVTATDASGCIGADDVTITETSSPVADFIAVNACTGEAVQFFDASTIAIGAITGWNWTFGDGNGSNQQNPTHVYTQPGNYDVILEVSAGSCTDQITLQVTSFPNPIASFSSANVCVGEAALFTDNSSATGSMIAAWVWDFGGQGNAVAQSPSFVFNTAGSYAVTLAVVTTDLCAASATQQITVYPAPVPAFTAADVCVGQATAFQNQSTVSSGLIVGQGWDFGDNVGTSTNSSPTYTYAAPGTYAATLAVTTSFGCSALLTQVVTVNPRPAVNAMHTDILCAGQTNGTAVATASGSTAPYSYLWSNAQQSTTPSIQNLGPGPYMVTVTDARGCTKDTTVVVLQPLPINVQMVAGDDTCALGNGAIQAVMLGGTAPFVYVWSAIRDSASIYSESVPPSGWNTGLSPGEYSVTVTDAGGCTAQGTGNVGLIAPPVAAFSTRSKPAEMKDPSVLFFNESQAAISYQWQFGEGGVSSQQHPVYDYEQAGVYLVMLIAYNEPRYGCSDTAFGYVEVDPLFTFYVPNAFTPDGDGKNDTWGPAGANYEYESYNVQVYDRWGKLVWQTDSPDRQWNGTDQGSLEPVRPGLYVYQFVVKQFNTFEPTKISGTVTLYRTRDIY